MLLLLLFLFIPLAASENLQNNLDITIQDTEVNYGDFQLLSKDLLDHFITNFHIRDYRFVDVPIVPKLFSTNKSWYLYKRDVDKTNTIRDLGIKERVFLDTSRWLYQIPWNQFISADCLVLLEEKKNNFKQENFNSKTKETIGKHYTDFFTYWSDFLIEKRDSLLQNFDPRPTAFDHLILYNRQEKKYEYFANSSNPVKTVLGKWGEKKIIKIVSQGFNYQANYNDILINSFSSGRLFHLYIQRNTSEDPFLVGLIEKITTSVEVANDQLDFCTKRSNLVKLACKILHYDIKTKCFIALYNFLNDLNKCCKIHCDSTILTEIVKRRKYQCIKTLLLYGVDPNEHGSESLEEAIVTKDVGMIRLLLQYGAKLDPFRDLEKDAPFVFDVLSKSEEIRKILLKANVCINGIVSKNVNNDIILENKEIDYGNFQILTKEILDKIIKFYVAGYDNVDVVPYTGILSTNKSWYLYKHDTDENTMQQYCLEKKVFFDTSKWFYQVPWRKFVKTNCTKVLHNFTEKVEQKNFNTKTQQTIVKNYTVFFNFLSNFLKENKNSLLYNYGNNHAYLLLYDRQNKKYEYTSDSINVIQSNNTLEKESHKRIMKMVCKNINYQTYYNGLFNNQKLSHGIYLQSHKNSQYPFLFKLIEKITTPVLLDEQDFRNKQRQLVKLGCKILKFDTRFKHFVVLSNFLTDLNKCCKLHLGSTILIEMVKRRNYQCVRALLLYGVDPNESGTEVLDIAIAEKDIDIVNLLLQYGAKANFLQNEAIKTLSKTPYYQEDEGIALENLNNDIVLQNTDIDYGNYFQVLKKETLDKIIQFYIDEYDNFDLTPSVAIFNTNKSWYLYKNDSDGNTMQQYCLEKKVFFDTSKWLYQIRWNQFLKNNCIEVLQSKIKEIQGKKFNTKTKQIIKKHYMDFFNYWHDFLLKKRIFLSNFNGSVQGHVLLYDRKEKKYEHYCDRVYGVTAHAAKVNDVKNGKERRVMKMVCEDLNQEFFRDSLLNNIDRKVTNVIYIQRNCKFFLLCSLIEKMKTVVSSEEPDFFNKRSHFVDLACRLLEFDIKYKHFLVLFNFLNDLNECCKIHHDSTILIEMIKRKNYQCIKALLLHGFNPNKGGSDALCQVVIEKDMKIVGLLLTFGANPLLFDKQLSAPLDYARANDDIEMIRLLEKYIQ